MGIAVVVVVVCGIFFGRRTYYIVPYRNQLSGFSFISRSGGHIKFDFSLVQCCVGAVGTKLYTKLLYYNNSCKRKGLSAQSSIGGVFLRDVSQSRFTYSIKEYRFK